MYYTYHQTGLPLQHFDLFGWQTLSCMADEYYTKNDFLDELDLNQSEFDQLPDEEMLDTVVSNIEERNVAVTVCESGDEAREYLTDQIPRDASVMSGHSTTMEEIGFTNVLETADGFEYIGNQLDELEDNARFEARRKATTADIFFDGVNAIAESGELIGANALGNGVGAWPFGAKELVLIGSTNKIMPTWIDAVKRLREYALPLEDARAQEVYGQGSLIGKLVSLEYERVDNRTQLVLIDDQLGF